MLKYFKITTPKSKICRIQLKAFFLERNVFYMFILEKQKALQNNNLSSTLRSYEKKRKSNLQYVEGRK